MEEMTKNNDVVIGSITNYDYDKLIPWINSLKQTGFTGTKIMMLYDIKFEVAQQLFEDFEIVTFQSRPGAATFEYPIKPFNIVVERFYNTWLWGKTTSKKYRYVIATDVADVVFQTNPSVWLEQNLGNKKLCVGSESLRYEDEAWGFNNMEISFGKKAIEYMSKRKIYNAGTIAGEFNTFIDLCYNVYLATGRAPLFVPGGGGPDQAALNLLLSFEPYKDITRFNSHDTNWACQCGTTMDPNKIDTLRPHLLDIEPRMVDDFVVNSENEKYVLVHQYNRVPEWKNILESKYGRRVYKI